MELPAKVFTVAEANEALAHVGPLVEQLQGLQQSIVTTNGELDGAVEKLAQGNGYPITDVKRQLRDLTKHQLDLIEAFQSALQQLEDLGCLLKDLNLGLVDFYAWRDGQMVFLCWKPGEDRVGFWHSVDEGFSGRKPLTDS